MAFSYDLGTDVGKVRLLISDVNELDHIYSDEELTVFLGMGGSVLLAAAMALENIAGNEVQVQKRIHILDLSTDGPSVSRELRELAALLRAQDEAGQGDDDTDFDIAEMAVDEFSRRHIITSDWLRGYAQTW